MQEGYLNTSSVTVDVDKDVNGDLTVDENQYSILQKPLIGILIGIQIKL